MSVISGVTSRGHATPLRVGDSGVFPGVSEQWVFRRGIGVTIDGVTLTGPDGVRVLSGGINGPWEIRVPRWARGYRFDGCSAGAGGGIFTGPQGAGGGCSGIAVMGYRKPCIPADIFTVTVGAGGARGVRAVGPLPPSPPASTAPPEPGSTIIASAFGLSNLAIGVGFIEGDWTMLTGATTPGVEVNHGVPEAGASAGTGGGIAVSGKAYVLGGAVGTGSAPGQPGTVFSAGRGNRLNAAGLDAWSVTAGGRSSHAALEDLAHYADNVQCMGGWGGTPGGVGISHFHYLSGGIYVNNTGAVGGLGGLCLPFVRWHTRPQSDYRGSDNARDRWRAWWTDEGAGYGRGGIGDRGSAPIDHGTAGGNGIAILTFSSDAVEV